jgi:hypothetical protein
MLTEETQMDWESLYCPNPRCRYYGIRFDQALMVKNGSSHGQKQALCRAGALKVEPSLYLSGA